MAASLENRPNIRIEIDNTGDVMEVDCVKDLDSGQQDDEEEGEIVEQAAEDGPRKEIAKPNSGGIFQNNQWLNAQGGFFTGVDIFSETEQKKLGERAERFGIDPSETKAMSDKQLEELHESLGINKENEKNTRFDAIHMRGTDEMSTKDIFDYFSVYGPASVEWINDESCNVVWLDTLSPARAFHGLTKPIEGMPVQGECNPFAEEKSSGGRSVLLLDEKGESAESDGKVRLSDIDAAVPPGYWRLGNPHQRAKYILLRFAKKTDKKPFKAERFSEYYKKYGNPNYGGMKGIITDSRRKMLKGIFTRTETAKHLGKNPWGVLARNWEDDHQEKEFPRTRADQGERPVLERIGIKRRLASGGGGDDADADDVEAADETTKKPKVLRMRMYADEEEEKIKQARVKKAIEALRVKPQKEVEVVDLRSRLGKDKRILTRPEIRNTVISMPVQARRTRIVRDYDDDEDYEHENEFKQSDNRQRSKVTMIIKTVQKPAIASVVRQRQIKQEGEGKATRHLRNNSSSDSSSESESDSSSESSSQSGDSGDGYTRNMKSSLAKSISRPGFDRRDLKSRLMGISSLEHRSPLRIEINNDLCENVKREKD